MAVEVSACSATAEILPAISPVFHYFGIQPTPPDAERFTPFVEPSRAFAARENGAVVGGCASFPFELTESTIPTITASAGRFLVISVIRALEPCTISTS